MDYICGFFDVQGFYIGEVFYPREIALLCGRNVFCASIVNNIRLDRMSNTEKIAVQNVSSTHHGLNFSASRNTGISEKDMKKTIKSFYYICSNADVFLLAVKSKEAETILRNLGIPRINLVPYGGTRRSVKTD